MGEFMALVFTELTKLAECMRIGDVLAVPSDVSVWPGDQITQDGGFDVNGFHEGNAKRKTGAAGRDDPAVVVRDSQRRMNRKVKGRISLLRRCASADAIGYGGLDEGQIPFVALL